ncbi:hypothetical protein PENANT_c164G11393, partial [Penicillium antarcticum]
LRQQQSSQDRSALSIGLAGRCYVNKTTSQPRACVNKAPRRDICVNKASNDVQAPLRGYKTTALARQSIGSSGPPGVFGLLE